MPDNKKRSQENEQDNEQDRVSSLRDDLPADRSVLLEGVRVCLTCHKEKPISNYNRYQKRPGSSIYYSRKCRTCVNRLARYGQLELPPRLGNRSGPAPPEAWERLWELIETNEDAFYRFCQFVGPKILPHVRRVERIVT